MTASRRRTWRAAPIVMLRAPALPIETALRVFETDADGSVAIDALGALLRDPEILLAIRVASPSAADAIAGVSDVRALRPKLRRALLAYLTRMSTRPTPFGLFAGVAPTVWGDRANLDLGGPPDVRRVRPDMGWLSAWSGRLERDPAIRSTLTVQTHAGVTQRGDRLFVEGPAGAAGAAPVQDVSIRATPVASTVLSRCRDGASYAEAVDAIVARGGDRTRAQAAVDTLIDQQFLVTSLRPALFGDPSRDLADVLRASGSHAASIACGALSQLMDKANEWEHARGTPALDGWRGLVASAQALEPGDPCLQVDAGFSARSITLPRAVAHEAARAIDLLWRTSPWTEGTAALREWRLRFDARWGPWREVPVLEALDEDAGLGVPDWQSRPASSELRDRLLVALAGDALRTGAAVVELDEPMMAAIERASGDRGPHPESADLFCALAAASAHDVDEGRFQLVVSSSGAVCPAGRAFGRFAHLLDVDGAETVADPSASVVDAELLFEPSRPRSANVMIRPLRHRHAVAVSGRVPAGSIALIPIDELSIVLRDGRLHLRWTTQGVDVRLAARHMLNVALMPPLARALQTIGLDATTALVGDFSWGAAASLPYRPRLQSGRVVLRPAEWNLDRRFFTHYAADRDAAAAERSLPRYVYAGLNEERLLLDTRSPAGALLLLDVGRRVPKNGRVVVQEALPGPEQACAAGSDGHRLVELVVSLTCARSAATHDRAETLRPTIAPRDRVKLPGSDWLYAKIYLPRALADDVLSGALVQQLADLERRALVDFWFYIRYVDPAFHIRLRLAGAPATLERDVLPQLSSWARDAHACGLVERLAFDTYEPEIERYGGPEALPIAERVFAADSRAAAALLTARRELAAAIEWDDLLVLSIDELVSSLGLDRAARVALYRRAADARPHAAAFRERRTRLRALLVDPAARPERLSAILASRRAAIVTLGAELRTLESRGALATPFRDVVLSLVHMHCNRLAGLGDLHEKKAMALAGMTLASIEAWPT